MPAPNIHISTTDHNYFVPSCASYGLLCTRLFESISMREFLLVASRNAVETHFVMALFLQLQVARAGVHVCTDIGIPYSDSNSSIK